MDRKQPSTTVYHVSSFLSCFTTCYIWMSLSIRTQTLLCCRSNRTQACPYNVCSVHNTNTSNEFPKGGRVDGSMGKTGETILRCQCQSVTFGLDGCVTGWRTHRYATRNKTSHLWTVPWSVLFPLLARCSLVGNGSQASRSCRRSSFVGEVRHRVRESPAASFGHSESNTQEAERRLRVRICWRHPRGMYMLSCIAIWRSKKGYS